jgi:hypothetical protein
MHKEILLLEPDAAPLTVFTKQIEGGGRRRKANDPLFSWHNDELEDRFDAVNNGAGYADNATDIVVDTSTLFAAEDLVKVPRTGEVLSVTSINTGTNTLTVVRGFGASTAAALVDNDPLLIIGTAAEEGDTSQAARSESPTKVDNYTQIFKTSIEASGSWISSANESSPHDWRHQQKKSGIEHKVDQEEAFLYGASGTTTGADGKPRRTTGGILEFATQNNQDAGGATTEAEIETFLRSGFRYGSQKKVLFASPLLVSVLNGFAQSKIQTVSRDKSYGIALMEWVSGHGTVGIVKHNLLEGAVYGGYGILIDFDRGQIAYRYLHGDGAPGGPRDTKLYENRQAPDRDGRLDEWITECGLQFGLPKAHAVLTGVTS